MVQEKADFFERLKTDGIDLKDERFKSQLKAVTSIKGPSLIIAGAGTGKTTTITCKIAYIIEQQAGRSDNILALTFSKAAAKHLAEETDKRAGKPTDATIKTFHAFCAEIIRDNCDKLGVPYDFKILEETDGAVLLYQQLKLSASNAANYVNTISKAKDLNISIADYENYIKKIKDRIKLLEPEEAKWAQLFEECTISLNTAHLEAPQTKEQKAQLKEDKETWVNFIELYDEFKKYESFVNAWKSYEILKRKFKSYDYSDLHHLALEFLNKYDSKKIAEKYDYVIVDEFQDNNFIQFELLKKIVGKDSNITAVCDPNQSVYAFRGAYTDIIKAYQEHYGLKQEDIIPLDKSIRSTNKILRTAHTLIQNNYDNPKDCLPITNYKGLEGDNIAVCRTVSGDEEARKCVEIIEELLKKGENYSNIAVLYRAHNHGKLLKQALEQRGYPISVMENKALLDAVETKTALAYLYILSSFTHPIATADQFWWRLFHYNYDLTPADTHKLGSYLKEQRISFHDAIYEHLADIGISKKGQVIIETIKNLFENLRTSKNKKISEIILDIYELSGLNRLFSHKDDREHRQRLLNLGNLVKMAEEYEELHSDNINDFIAYLEILDEMDAFPSIQRIEEDEAIKLMSMHGAKGLEWNNVLLVGWVEDRFPLYKGGTEPLIPDELNPQLKRLYSSKQEPDEKEIKEEKKKLKRKEERRLGYVSITRAKNRLFMVFGKDYGGKNEKEPSEFMEEIGFDGQKFSSKDIDFTEDTDVKAINVMPDTDLDRRKREIKRKLIECLDRDSFEDALGYLCIYQSLKDKKCDDYLERIKKEWNKISPDERIKDVLKQIETKEQGIKFDPKNVRFSISSIGVYAECPKRYELNCVLQMPTRDSEDSEGAMNKGSFVHEILEYAAKQKIKSEKELFDIYNQLLHEPRWYGVNTKDVELMLKVFWKRNKDKMKNIIHSEMRFRTPIEGLTFSGAIDRVDEISKGELEIIDYKTGKEPDKEEREMQLALYAYAMKAQYPDKKIRRLTLELLSPKSPSPRIYDVDDAGNMTSPRIQAVNMNDVVKKIVDIAKAIASDYEKGFAPVKDDSSCERCSYKLYCPKWG